MSEHYGERLCVEQGRPEDAQELMAVLRQVGSETDNLTFGAEGPSTTVEQEQEYLRAMAENPTSAFFVARLDGRMVGSLSFRAMTLARASHRAEIGIVNISPFDAGIHFGSHSDEIDLRFVRKPIFPALRKNITVVC